VTILDVAERAGVGVGTVSRVINGADHVRPATREKIEAAMRELNFHPNAQARNLKRGSVNTLGFFFNSGQRRLSDPFFNTLMAGMADACGDHNYDLLVASCRDPQDELAALEKLIRSNRVAGIIITDTRLRDPRVAMLQRLEFPCVVFGRVGARSGVPFVDVDGKRGVEQAVLHLLERGHHRIGFIGLPSDLTCAQDRLAGYRAAIEAAQLRLNEKLIQAGGLTETAGRHAAQALLSQSSRPTAIIACSDVLAFGVMQAAQDAGVRIGRDLAVVGFDDIPMAAHINPPLTTVRQPIYDIGVQLASLSIEHLRGESDRAIQKLIEPELIIRESTSHVLRNTKSTKMNEQDAAI
jgi:DNA-binding LacI/PurR family transcriptional regulator